MPQQNQTDKICYMTTFVSSIVVATLTVSVFAQSVPTIDSLYRKVQGFGIGLPQEKVYLHLDNTCYFVDDTIWYKDTSHAATKEH